jgi:hypothetical protein
MLRRILTIVKAIIFIALTTQYFAQGKFGQIGKFLKSSDADILFGKVTLSIPINTSELQEAISNAKDYILFRISGNKVIITNEARKKLTRNSGDANERDMMFFFSKDIISSLVNFAGTRPIVIENRANNIFTITINPKSKSQRESELPLNSIKTGSQNSVMSSAADEAITLEMSSTCPPICWE